MLLYFYFISPVCIHTSMLHDAIEIPKRLPYLNLLTVLHNLIMNELELLPKLISVDYTML